MVKYLDRPLWAPNKEDQHTLSSSAGSTWIGEGFHLHAQADAGQSFWGSNGAKCPRMQVLSPDNLDSIAGIVPNHYVWPWPNNFQNSVCSLVELEYNTILVSYSCNKLPQT